MPAGPDTALDAVVVGAGPNGLAAAVTLAAHGLAVRLYEARGTVGGGCRTAELTLPGFAHDVCSAVHPMAVASPFLRAVDPASCGVRLAEPAVAYAHPLDGGRAAAVVRSVEETAERLGADGAAYRRLFGPLAEHSDAIVEAFLAPLRSVPRDPLAITRFMALGAFPAELVARAAFRTDAARALFAGASAHSMLSLRRPPTAAFGLLLGLLAHAAGWPVVVGGSQELSDALARLLTDLGGEIVTEAPIRSLTELPRAQAVLLDVTPAQLLDLAGDDLPGGYRAALRRYRYGPGVFKVDYALAAPVPWANDDCRFAGTLHLGGTLAEIAASERDAARGVHSDAPYVLAVQATVADPTRAPAGQHTLWAYCHVPAGSTLDMTDAIEQQIERFAPGFRDVVLARATRNAREYEAYDANYVGGDINGGVQDIRQTLFRPVPRWDTYRVPRRGTYLCSSATPPGGAVHGMCGWHAARDALRREFGIRTDLFRLSAALRTRRAVAVAP